MELMGNISISIKSKTNFPTIVPNAFYKVFMASQVELMHVVSKPYFYIPINILVNTYASIMKERVRATIRINWRKKWRKEVVKILRFLFSLKRPGGIQRRPGTWLAYPQRGPALGVLQIIFRVPAKGHRNRRHSAWTLASDLNGVGIVGKANWNGILLEPLAQKWDIGCTHDFQIRHVSPH
jgi:hypothetical protein